MTALVTAVYGGYDAVAPAPGDFDDHVLVTDERGLQAPGWRTVHAPSGFHPRLAAKRPKCMPWTFTDCDRSVWVDGSIEVRPGLRAFADALLDEYPVVAADHPEAGSRPTIREEASHSAPLPKYTNQPVLMQARWYLEQGCPGRLYACGVVARRHEDGPMRAGGDWLRECHDWSVQDQLSFPWAHWSNGVEPGTFGLPLLANDYWVRRPHRDGT